MAVEIKQFSAEWCGPCSQQKEILEDFDAAPVRAIDVDEDQQTARDYGVRGIPTLVVEVEGEEVERFTGVTQLEEIENAVDRNA